MKRITSAALERVNQASIQRAGPRYTPTIDANAPNLEIRPLVNTVEALAHSAVYKKHLDDLGTQLRAAWQKAPVEIRSLFDKKTAASELGATFIRELVKEKPGSSTATLLQIRRTLAKVQARLRPYEKGLYDERLKGDNSTQSREAIASRLHALQQFQRPIEKLDEFIDSPDFEVIRNNRLFLKGGWGAGKTHLLCDVVKSRSLPSLLLMAHTFSPETGPLVAACQVSGLANTPHELLQALDRLGKKSGGRALFVIDGINEGDRVAWRRHMASVIQRVRKFDNVALILSCRTPFDNQILTTRSRREFVQLVHTGFGDIEFDAQREFFRYYEIPTPHIPLLAPEFSRPLFLKILCESIASLSRGAKQQRINDFAAGHKGMTKLLEDFVVRVGRNIESDFGLPNKCCWRLLKGQGEGAASIGISVRMAEQCRDYVLRSECLEIIMAVTDFHAAAAEAFLSRLVTDGLLTDDRIFEDDIWKDVVRLPYQRFSDHLVSRHLLSRHLKTGSESQIRRSFYSNRPLGKIFKPSRWGWDFEMPGLASAVMLEFPERVKRTLPEDKRELLFYLPSTSRTAGLMDPFIEGLLWRSTDSFSAQTDQLVSYLLDSERPHIRKAMLEALVCLASRTGHPYSAERLCRYLSRKSLIDRDISWSEFLRSAAAPSAVYRLVDWIIASQKEPIGEATANNLIWLCCLLLTTTVRSLRDRATRCLVLLGERHPRLLFEATSASFLFNDPYVPERMLAASYGVLMRNWAFPPPDLKQSAITLATELRRRLKGSKTLAPLEHILIRDYAEGIIALTQKLSPAAKSRLSLDGVRVAQKSLIPSSSRISEKTVKAASEAIHMDFGNYTMGRLVENRANYDFDNPDYRRVRRQISWRILNLGYDPKKFEHIDRDIGSANFHMGRSDGGKKIDRYGKKYSWIAYYEIAGRRQLSGTLPDRDDIRISDTDIDPSFPDHALEWQPPLPSPFEATYRAPASWMRQGRSPNYRAVLLREEVDSIVGPWVLLQGFISERSSKDPREVFTFLRGLLIAPTDLSRLDAILRATEYPGNHAIPDPSTDYYLFAGEIGWSRKFGSRLRGDSKRAKPQLVETLARYDRRVIKKRYAELTPAERLSLAVQTLSITFGAERVDVRKDEPRPKSQFVKLQRFERIPGVNAELPSWGFSWESYHSQENQDASADYPAPSLVDYLRLRKAGGAIDLVDESGRVGMAYRKFRDRPDGFHSHLLYLRADLLKKYLARTRRLLVWVNWGERTMHHSVSEQIRQKPAVQAVWKRHDHIHKELLVYKDGHAQMIEGGLLSPLYPPIQNLTYDASTSSNEGRAHEAS